MYPEVQYNGQERWRKRLVGRRLPNLTAMQSELYTCLQLSFFYIRTHYNICHLTIEGRDKVKCYVKK